MVNGMSRVNGTCTLNSTRKTNGACGTEIVAEEILTETIMGTETVFELPVTREESGPIESDKPDLIAGETSELFQTNKGMSLREIKIIRKGLELIND